MKYARYYELLIVVWSLMAGCICLAEQPNPEESSNDNPLATFDDIERLLEERGDKLSAQEKYQLRVWMEHFKTPINFWAQVVDTEGNAIPNAKVHIEVMDDPNMDWEAERNNSEYELLSDENGKVSLLNKIGGGLRAVASAEGYAPVYDGLDPSSEARYNAGNGNDPHAIPWATEETACILVLRKKGIVPNIKYYSSRFLTPHSDGRPLRVDIHGGEYLVEVRLWSSRPEEPNFDDEWDWRAEIKPIKGQIRMRDQSHPHVAPSDAYLDKFEIVMKAGDEEWRSSRIGGRSEYWIRWEDGTHAMVDLDISTRNQNRIIVESWVNLDRNNSFEDWQEQEREQRKKR